MATRNPSLNIRPDVAKAAGLKKGPAADTDYLVGPRPASWYTGKHPTQCPGFNSKDNTLRALPLPNTHNYTRQSLLDYFDNTWTQTEVRGHPVCVFLGMFRSEELCVYLCTQVLFAALQGHEAFICPPYHQLRHPLIFYYNHPAVLYVNKLRVAGVLEDGIDQFFEQMRCGLFEVGVDEMSWDDLSQAKEDWPSVEAVTDYRRKAYLIIKEQSTCCHKRAAVGQLHLLPEATADFSQSIWSVHWSPCVS
eukprot:1139049-Pelagomonas_calceolata.AAC.2